MEASLLFIMKSMPDSEILQNDISNALTLDGFEQPVQILIAHAVSVEDGERLLFERSPTLLAVDAEIDNMLEFVRSLKNDEMFRFLPIVVITHPGTVERDEEFFASGADGFVRTPLSGKSLFHAVRPLIRNKLLADDVQNKLMNLQDEHIKNFILLDLVRRYIPKTVWDIANRFADEQTIRIPETEEEVTIVYGDIAGFTTISQYLKPKDVISMLNEAYEIVTGITYEYEGDIDKFIGDAFLAVFTSAKPAILSALKIQFALDILNASRKERELAPIRFRIGVHTGPVIRGNVGGELRNDNTLIGDTVNTASRIESITPPGEVLVSEQACSRAGISVPGMYRVEERVKGKDNLIVSYNIFKFSCDNDRRIDVV